LSARAANARFRNHTFEHMSSLLVRSLFLGTGLAIGFPRAGLGQAVQERAVVPPAVQQPVPGAQPRRNAFAINPLGIPFEIVSIEFESALHDAFTLAGNFSYFSPDDYTRSSFEVKGRLYPNERAPQGFSVGFGVGGVNTRETIDVNGIDERRDHTAPSIGVYVDYNWLLGRSNRFFVGTGVGAKRILRDRDDFDSAPRVYGTARFLIGVAF
jgi:hypothetical protein